MANEIKVNGNCKGVKDITNNIDYKSVTAAAIANGVKCSTMSVAIREGYLCNGSRFKFQKDLHECGDELCAENAKANARAVRAEAKVAEMEAEMAEYRLWKAEQEAKRKAEEAARKEEEKRQEKIAKLTKKIECYDRLIDKAEAQKNRLYNERVELEVELEALLDRKEVS